MLDTKHEVTECLRKTEPAAQRGEYGNLLVDSTGSK